MRTLRVTPPAPGSSPSCTSGKPTTALGSSTTMRWCVARATSRPPPSAAPLIAATTGLPSVSSRRSEALKARMKSLNSSRFAGVIAFRTFQVCARHERALGGGDHDARELLLLGVEPVDGGFESLGEGLVDRVGGAGGVEREHDDAVRVALPVDDLGVAHLVLTVARRSLGHAQIASTTVAMPMPAATHSVTSP